MTIILPLPEHEIEQRVIRAVKDAGYDPKGCRASIQIASQALRDLDKPIIDPVLLKCREICANAALNPHYYMNGSQDEGARMKLAIAAYTAGKADREGL